MAVGHLGRDLFQAVLSAGDEEKRVALGGEPVGVDRANTGGSSGDDGQVPRFSDGHDGRSLSMREIVGLDVCAPRGAVQKETPV